MGWTILLLVLVAGDAQADRAEDASRAAAPSAPRRAVDRSYRPAVGDRALLHNENPEGKTDPVWATATSGAFREYLKAAAMGDVQRMRGLEREGKSVRLVDEAPVVVVSVQPVSFLLSDDHFVSNTAVSVRVLDGPGKDRVYFTSADQVARFARVADAAPARRPASRKPPKPAPARAPAKVSDPAARASAQFRLGRDLEKLGKLAGALEFYRAVVLQDPASPQARAAAARIEALAGR